MMKFEIGDKVRLIHSGEEGVVTEVLDENMVKVEVAGTDFPVFNDQLEYPYFQRFTEMRKNRKNKKKRIKGEDIPTERAKKVSNRKESGMQLSLLPIYDEVEEEVVTSMKLYLVNETAALFNYQFKEYLNEALELEMKSTIRPFSRLFLKDFPFENLNDHPRFTFIFFPEKPSKEMLPSFPYTLKLKAKQVFRKITHLEDHQNAMFSYTIFEKYPLKDDRQPDNWVSIKTTSEITYVNKSRPVARQEAPYEVDLHIERLTDDFRNMTPSDMLLLQLTTLRNAIENAIAQRQYSMIVIHGIGKGVLKREVHAVLKEYPNIKRFVNQHDFRYGFGATEIFFTYAT